MVSFTMRKNTLLTIFLAGILAAFALPKSVVGQNEPPPPPTNNVKVEYIVTDNVFDYVNCPVRRFYTRAAFLEALNSYPQFGRVGSIDDSKREIAAFFAHAAFESAHLCDKEDPLGNFTDYCDKSKTQYPCNPSKSYHGRGPLQLKWNYNYGPAGESIGFDGLNIPEAVSTLPVLSFKASLWFWMKNCHSLITSGQGFGSTIRAINGAHECDGRNPIDVQTRINYYIEFCNLIDVQPGAWKNLTC